MFSVLAAAPIASPDDVPTAAPVYAGMAVVDAATQSDKQDKAKTPAPAKTPLVSISTDILDMSWTGAMDLADPAILRPAGIVLPFLESYPIDNFEVKLHLLNVRF